MTRTKLRPQRLYCSWFSSLQQSAVRSPDSSPPRFGHGLTPSLVVMLANAKLWSFYSKTWYSEYSKWLSPVAFWPSFRVHASNSFSAEALRRTLLGRLQRSPIPRSWFKGPYSSSPSSNEEIMVACCQKTGRIPNKVPKQFQKCVRRYFEPETVRHGRNYRAG